jgi:hypothetical protein
VELLFGDLLGRKALCQSKQKFQTRRQESARPAQVFRQGLEKAGEHAGPGPAHEPVVEGLCGRFKQQIYRNDVCDHERIITCRPFGRQALHMT